MTKRDYRRIVVKGNKNRRHRKSGYKILRLAPNGYTGINVELTMMTAKSGKIIYAVLVRNRKTGKYYRIYKFANGIGEAWKCYKNCIAA